MVGDSPWIIANFVPTGSQAKAWIGSLTSTLSTGTCFCLMWKISKLQYMPEYFISLLSFLALAYLQTQVANYFCFFLEFPSVPVYFDTQVVARLLPVNLTVSNIKKIFLPNLIPIGKFQKSHASRNIFVFGHPICHNIISWGPNHDQNLLITIRYGICKKRLPTEVTNSVDFYRFFVQ